MIRTERFAGETVMDQYRDLCKKALPDAGNLGLRGRMMRLVQSVEIKAE